MNKDDKVLFDSFCEMIDPVEETTDKVVWLVREIKIVRQEVMNNPSPGGTIALVAMLDSLLHVLEENKAA